jgi:hypothetical protein
MALQKSDKLFSKEFEEEMTKRIEEALSKDQEEKEKRLEKYPPNPPNEFCNYAFIKGFSIENSFGPIVKEYNPFFEVESEKLYVWTYRENKNSAIISEVSALVKEQPFWKSIGNVLQLAFAFTDAFEYSTSDSEIDYKWIYYFDPITTNIDEAVFSNMNYLELHSISNGRIVKATDISSRANIIELIMRDDKAFTSLALLNSSFSMSYCCLNCELSEYPWHDHLTDEPQIWEQASILPQMEAATVQACRCAEGILGEPPNRSKPGKLYAFKEKINLLLGINVDDIFTKANKSYLDFYYDLFFDLRNPSAHNYGNIHFDLERKKVIEAQCFAATILLKYFDKNIKSNEEAMEIFKFNTEFLDRVDESMSTPMTK